MVRLIGIQALVLSAFMLLVAGRAEAQACAVPDDVPAELYDAYLDLLGPGFPFADPSACEKLTKGALSACQQSVSSSVRCWKGLIKRLAKGAKTTCQEQGPEEEACFEGTGANLAGQIQGVAASEADGRVACEEIAETFFDFCINGP